MAIDSEKRERDRDRASARAGLRRAAAEAAARGTKLRLDAQTAMLILRATGAADLDPEVLIGLLVTSLEQAELAPVLGPPASDSAVCSPADPPKTPTESNDRWRASATSRATASMASETPCGRFRQLTGPGSEGSR